MTPQLMQAIKLLQLSNLDLVAYVEGELERNPLLERTPEDEGGPAEAPAEAETAGAQGGDEWIGDQLETSRASLENNLGTNLENVFPDEASSAAPAGPGPGSMQDWSGPAPSSDDYSIEAFVAAEVTLTAHLEEQLVLAVSDPVQRLIGRHLIDLVDEAGYLPADLSGIADQLGVSLLDIEAVVAILQCFEPTGICARSLGECLAAQLRERDRFDPAMQALVGHLELLARRDVAALRRICGVDDEDLRDMIAEIRQLDPKPGARFGGGLTQPVVPDVFARSGPDGGWIVELNSETLPRVLVNQSYYAELSKSVRKSEDKTYFTDCLQNATWLVRALDQRARTILKVSTEIVRQQDGFFTRGVAHLRPLNLKAVADAIQMHESTVSRVTANKYIATSRGIFELKYFFTASIASADGGEAHSAEAVRHRIRQMIEAESSNAVLSDDAIVDKLRQGGVDIARRTVAKYREAMRIPSSVQRRRNKQSDSVPSAAAAESLPLPAVSA
jgi:RNA polymerase sigma-54 factor